MEFNRENILNKSTTAKKSVVMDEGLRAYMLKVYNYMASGVLLTGVLAALFFQLSGGYNIQVTSLGITGLNSFGYDLRKR